MVIKPFLKIKMSAGREAYGHFMVMVATVPSLAQGNYTQPNH